MNKAAPSPTVIGLLGAVWGVAGLSLILVDAINRLSRIALQAMDEPLAPVHWFALVAVVAAMAYAEGYRGFQKSFSPRSAARAYYLYRNPEPVGIVLAPLFCMGFFRATRGPLLFAWVGTLLAGAANDSTTLARHHRLGRSGRPQLGARFLSPVGVPGFSYRRVSSSAGGTPRRAVHRCGGRGRSVARRNPLLSRGRYVFAS